MVRLNVETDVAKLERALSNLSDKQIKQATAFALTDIGAAVVKAEIETTKQVFNNPTPFITKAPRKSGGSNAFRLTFAKPNKLWSEITIQPKQAQSLHWQIEGGQKTPNRRALKLPSTAIKLNKYGNLPRNKVNTLMKKTGTGKGSMFSGAPRNHPRFGNAPGIYQRQGKKGKDRLVPQLFWSSFANYRKRFPFYEVGKVIVRDHFAKELNRQIAKAVRKAQQASR